jgi:hypothetical protein
VVLAHDDLRTALAGHRIRRAGPREDARDGGRLQVVGVVRHSKYLSVLYDVKPLDPLVVGLAPAVIVLVCATAAWLPSRRATRISAAAALRCE